MALAALILAVIGVAPIFWQAIYEETRSLVYIRFDPFIAYSPGKLYGPSLNPLVRREGIPAKLQLPRSPIRVTDLEGNQVDGDICVLEITVWNGGAKNINGDEVRQPLSISIAGARRIIDTQILYGDARNGFQITHPESVLPSVQVTWRYLDRNAGLKLAVTFTADDQIDPRAQLFFAGDLVEGNKSSFDRNVTRTISTILFFAIAVSACVVGSRKLPGVWRLVPIVLMISVMFYLSWWLAKNLSPSVPPF